MFRNKVFIILMLVITILLSSFLFYGYQILYSPNFLINKNNKILIINRNETFKTLQKKLYDNDYINDLVSFSFLSKIMGFDKSIKPGRYMIKTNMNNIEAIRMLRIGIQDPVKITFNNIRLMNDLSKKITKNLSISSSEFDVAMLNFLNKNKEFNPQNCIAMFIPNTYEVYYDISSEDLIERMHYEFKTFWNSSRREKASKLGLRPAEVVTLASIVNAESVKKDESKIIAGLYINRLKKGIPLQADPTLVFSSKDFSLKRVLNEHKKIDSPYNTYKYKGLPPGPINMPPIYTIDAVLDYQKHNYIYMCAKEDFSGYHYFARSLREHQKNASKYRRQLSIEQRKAKLKNQK